MGTRSAIGFHVNGQDKLMYNQFDGYPTYMGERVFKDAMRLKKNLGWKKLKQKVENIISIDMDSDDKPSGNDFKKYKKLHDPSVSTGGDWYSLLRNLQGNLYDVVKAGIMLEANNFIHDSLFCEWAYIINLDTKKLEIYAGFQQSKPVGRYADIPANNGYYACSLVKEIDLTKKEELLYIVLSGDTFWQNIERPEGEE